MCAKKQAARCGRRLRLVGLASTVEALAVRRVVIMASDCTGMPKPFAARMKQLAPPV